MSIINLIHSQMISNVFTKLHTWMIKNIYRCVAEDDTFHEKKKLVDDHDEYLQSVQSYFLKDFEMNWSKIYISKKWHCFVQDSRPAECVCSVSVSMMIKLLNDSYWKQTHATCTAQHTDDWKRDRETWQRIHLNIVRKYHDAYATISVHACRRKNNKGQATYPEETSHNSTGYGIQVSTSNTHPWLLSRRVCLQRYHSWPMLCAHRTTQKQSNRIETWRAWLEHTIEFNTSPQPCEYTFEFSTGTGLYCLVAINSLSHSLQLLRLINGRNISSSFVLGVCDNMSVKFCVLDIFFTPAPPQQSSLEVKRLSNPFASCVQHLVYGRMHVPRCCPLWFQFHSVPIQQTSTPLATTVPPWCLPTLPSPLLHNCSMPLKPDPDYELQPHAFCHEPLVLFRVTWSLAQSESV